MARDYPSSCTECEFWDELPPDPPGSKPPLVAAVPPPKEPRKGLCRGTLPSPTHEPDPKGQLTYWSTTTEKDWCAAGKPIEQVSLG
jgi:hypothetical protein